MVEIIGDRVNPEVQLVVNGDGSTNTKTQSETIYLDDVSTPNVIYLGYASPGASITDPVWKIKTLDTTGGFLIIKYAHGNANYDNVWNSRTIYIYS